ncbi:unnamed protein product [Peronospora belbahrii]|uniref:Uncharacterized protein n=1 Tax=Peronospora belbahrii TaxID=622444 RepID=A0AAU9LG29_9STRA|nr:unnamed protein product [Peronospora belbahrii]CAH0521350.1 unnamed protein product [Peronospora belbahrii]
MCKPLKCVARQVKYDDPMSLFLTKASILPASMAREQRLATVLKALLKVTKGKAMQLEWMCEVVKGLSRYHDEVLVLLADDVFTDWE